MIGVCGIGGTAWRAWRWQGALSGLGRDRRGAVSMIFSVCLVVVVGVVGLGTEGAMWYLQRQQGQNAADAAAESGGSALMRDQDAGVSATAAASMTGFPASALSVSTGSWSSNGTYTPGASPANAVKVVVAQTYQPMLASLFLAKPVTITESAIATIIPASATPCVLALSAGAAEGIGFNGNGAINCNEGSVASNTTSGDSIGMNGNTAITATTVISSGNCSGCDGHLDLTYPMQTDQPPTTDPFAAVQTVALPSFSGSGCRPMPSLHGTVSLPPSSTQAFCAGADLKINSTDVVNLSPGMYFFYGSNISITGNATLQCPSCTNGQGVTLIMTGPNNGADTGSLDISGGVTVTLSAAANNSWNPAFDGILFYVDARSGAPVTVTGGSGIAMAGGLYFPSSAVKFAGGGSADAQTICSILVSATLTISGDSYFGTNGCPALGLPTSSGQSVKLVE